MHLLLLFPFLLWLSGSSGAREGITGPGTVRGPERGNLSVWCHYDEGWETYYKYWCRGAAWSHCEILIITTGSEQEVRQGRVTIRDNHRSRTFTVTMEQLREDDADIYWCGMETFWADPGVQVKVIVDPAPTTVLTTSPTTVTSTTNTSVVPNTVSTPLSSTWRETYSSSTMSRHSGEGRRIEAMFLCCGEGPSATSFSPDLAHTNSRTQRPSLKPAGSSNAREPISGPGTVRGRGRGNLSVRCHYDKGWETYHKYWCRGAAWSHCEILIIAPGSEQRIRQGRVTIRDNHRSRTFTVTMEQLREDDADIYWCGIKSSGSDPGVQVKVIVDPAPAIRRKNHGSSTVSRHSGEGRRIEATFLCCGEGPSATSFSPDLAHTNSRTQRPSLKPAGSSNAREPTSGPETVRGPERGNLSVQCHYGRGWETYKKYWCRGAAWSHCKILIITTGSEQEVRQGRVSIRDHHRSRMFTVTMEQLRKDDAGTYWCGMERVGADPGVQVKVIVDSGMKTTTDLSPTPPVTETSGGQHVPPTRSWLSSDHSLNLFLLPIFLKLPLLLGTLGAVLWVSMWWRSPEWQAEPAQWELAAAVPDQTERPSMKTESFH
ncbi:CMRF35-like molecule 1 isoform X2 [Ochotona curzoniae]|uniref:CMRF35-like molecule 1 isoform X2 n=1 Tax=Ochotona curzoniae TaxID=130825 RepID=UPI001B3541E0|nr:CMRF35-like molecule 1 isoform X2 [Ochotona curzoniae]